MDFFDFGDFVDGVQDHDHHDGRAVRVRDNALAAIFGLVQLDVFGVHFGNHQRNGRIHAEETGVIDDHGAVFDGDGGEFLGDGSPCGTQYEIDTLEGILVQDFALEGFALELEFATGATLGSEKFQALERKVALLENGEDFLAYGTGGTHDGNIANHN